MEDKRIIQLPIFSGKLREIIPKMDKLGYSPISIADIKIQRIRAWQTENRELIKQWDCYMESVADAFAFHPDGRVKLVLDSKYLLDINAKNDSKWLHSIKLPDNTFDTLEGEVFNFGLFNKYSNHEVQKVWQILAREDEYLNCAYRNKVAKVGGEYGMGLWFEDDTPQCEVIKPICIAGNSNFNYISCDNDFGKLDLNNSRIIGIPNSLSFKNKKSNLEMQLRVSNL